MAGAFLLIVARMAVALLCFLPMRWAAQIGRGFGGLVYYVDGRHRRVALNNLTHCFGATKTQAAIAEIAHENFRRIGENICCAVKSASLDERALSGVLQVERSPSAQAAAGFTARNVVMASGHFGSFELFSRLPGHISEYRHACTYRGIRQQGLDHLLRSLRAKAGMELFERRAGSDLLKKSLSKGGLSLVLFCDQSDRANGLELPFLGRPAYTNRAPAVMALRYDCALFVPICYRVGLGQYRIEIGEPIATRQQCGRHRTCEEITRDINAAFEAAILRDPANWFWVHNRWKRKTA